MLDEGFFCWAATFGSSIFLLRSTEICERRRTMANRNRIDIPFYKDNYVPSNTTHDNEYDDDIFATPKALHKYLDDSFFGHDTFKRELAVFFLEVT